MIWLSRTVVGWEPDQQRVVCTRLGSNAPLRFRHGTEGRIAPLNARDVKVNTRGRRRSNFSLPQLPRRPGYLSKTDRFHSGR